MKKINELFDDQYQKDNSGDAKFDPSNVQKSNPILAYLHKIWFEIPVLEKCYLSPDENHFLTTNESALGPIMTFIVRNDEYHLSVTFYFPEWHKSNVCVLWQRSDYTGDIIVPLDDDSDYCHIGDFELVTSEEAADVLKNHFVPLLKRFNFPSYYFNKGVSSSRMN